MTSYILLLTLVRHLENIAILETFPQLSGPLFGPKTRTANDATFGNFSRSTMHLMKSKGQDQYPETL